MNAFRKSRKRVSRPFDNGSNTVNDTVVLSHVTSVPEGSEEPVTFIEVKKCRVDDSALVDQLPKDEDYQLRDMIAAGQIPEEVPVHGVLDSSDPTDLLNECARDVLLSKLSGGKSTKAAVAAPTSEPTPEPTPSVES